LRSIACNSTESSGLVAQQFVAGAQIRRGRRVIFDADAPEALDQHARGAVGKFHHLGQARDAADFVQILRRRLGDFRLALQHRAEQPVARDDVVNQLQARPGLDEQRHDRAGKNHDVRQAEDGQVSGSERDEMRGGDFRFFGAPRMLTNSVSGDVIVVPSVVKLDAAPGKDSRAV
jgi:hypothetical protein